MPAQAPTELPTTSFKVGDRVVDRDGFEGVVSEVVHWNGSHWYDVRLPGGLAVRYDNDLRSRA